MTPNVTLIAPSYNEEAVIARFVHTLLPALRPRWEILIVDDGSTDTTPGIADSLAAEHPQVRVVHHEVNRGLGAALVTGFANARGSVVVTMDADLSHPVDLVSRLVEQCADADAVFASRYVAGGGMNGVPWWRRAISILGNAVFRVLFGTRVRDLTTGYRAYRTAAVRDLPIEADGFEIQLEIAVRLIAARAKIKELPLVLTVRAAGESKMRYARLIGPYLKTVCRMLVLRWFGR